MKLIRTVSFSMLSSLFSSLRTLVLVALASTLVLVGCDSAGTNGNNDGTGNDGSDTTTVAAPVDGFTSQPAPIVVDGNGGDWTELDVRQSDVGDGDGGVGIERLWVAHTAHHLFLRLTVDQVINLQEDNDLTLYLDTDNDPTTGTSALGLGAELQWTFGARTGEVGTGTVGHADIGLTSLPTVRSDTFELALDRSVQPGGEALFSGDSLRVALSSQGDRLPDADGGLGYEFSDTEATAAAPLPDRPSTSDVRVLSYNVLQGSIFDTEVHPNYRRILEAIGPDVFGLQEVSASAAETEQVAEEELGIPDAWEWDKAENGLVLGSRYPIQGTHVIPGTEDDPSGAFLLDARDALGDSLIVVLMHPKCCGGSENDQLRQETVDGVAAFLRDVTKGEGPFGVQSNTPIVVTGDMNFVGDPQQPRTLRTGEIQTDRFGMPADPDWDDSPLLDTNPRQTGVPFHTTWVDSGSSFPPGRLDYAYVTDSVLEVVHEFVLNTRALPDGELNEHGLERDDTVVASDHLPLVIDVARR